MTERKSMRIFTILSAVVASTVLFACSPASTSHVGHQCNHKDAIVLCQHPHK